MSDDSKSTAASAASRWARFQPPPLREATSIAEAIAKLNNMTPDEVFQSSVLAGVHNPDGTLDSHYCDPIKR